MIVNHTPLNSYSGLNHSLKWAGPNVTLGANELKQVEQI